MADSAWTPRRLSSRENSGWEPDAGTELAGEQARGQPAQSADSVLPLFRFPRGENLRQPAYAGGVGSDTLWGAPLGERCLFLSPEAAVLGGPAEPSLSGVAQRDELILTYIKECLLRVDERWRARGVGGWVGGERGLLSRRGGGWMQASAVTHARERGVSWNGDGELLLSLPPGASGKPPPIPI